MQARKTLAESVGSNLNVSASKHHTIMQIITAVFLCTMCRVHVFVYEMCFCLSFCVSVYVFFGSYGCICVLVNGLQCLHMYVILYLRFICNSGFTTSNL